MRFKYVGYNLRGRKVQGRIEANSASEAKRELLGQKIRISKLRQMTKNAEVFDLQLFGGSGKPKLGDFNAFIRQLANMQGAGMPLVQSLSILIKDCPNKKFGGVLLNVRGRIESGSTFAEALRAHPRVFDSIFINLIAAGEISGSMETVLLRLAVYYEKVLALKRKVQGAMMYPVIILVVMILVLFAMMMFVVPKFAEMFQEGNAKLPEITQMLLDASNFTRDQWHLMLLGLFGAGFFARFLYMNEETKKYIDRYLLMMPIFGDLLLKNSIARFSRTLGTLLQSGVSVLESLKMSSHVVGNFMIQAEVLKAYRAIKEGSTIAAPLAKSKYFPGMAVSMISVGESTGSLDTMLNKIAEYYEEEVEWSVQSITTLIEPIMIVVIGIVVLGLLVALYMPILERAVIS